MGDQMAYNAKPKTPAINHFPSERRSKNRFPSVPDIMKTYDGTYKTKILTNDELDISVTRKVTQLRNMKSKAVSSKKLVMMMEKMKREKSSTGSSIIKAKERDLGGVWR